MTDVEIQKDRDERTAACKKEMYAVLDKYELGIIAQDQWSPSTQIIIDISFTDKKVYATAPTAVPEKESVSLNPNNNI